MKYVVSWFGLRVTCTRLLRENGSSDFTLEMRSGDRGVTVLCLQIYSIHPRNINQVPVVYPQGKGLCTKRAESELISKREGSDVNEKTSQYVGRGNVLRRTMHGTGGVQRGGQTAATRGDPGRLMESWHSGEDLRRCGRHRAGFQADAGAPRPGTAVGGCPRQAEVVSSTPTPTPMASLLGGDSNISRHRKTAIGSAGGDRPLGGCQWPGALICATPLTA